MVVSGPEGEELKFQGPLKATVCTKSFPSHSFNHNESWVQSLIHEGPTCHGAPKPMCHSDWAGALLGSLNYWNLRSQSQQSTTGEAAPMRGTPSTTGEAPLQQWGPSIARNKCVNENYLKKKKVWRPSTKTDVCLPHRGLTKVSKVHCTLFYWIYNVMLDLGVQHNDLIPAL